MPSTPDKLAKEINRVLGEGTVKMASDPSFVVHRLATGVLPIDVLLDGGIPRGRFVEIYGAFSTFKSWVALNAIAECQANGLTAALIDTEHAFDPDWASSLGVQNQDLVYQAPDSGEAAVDAAELLIRSGVDLLVWDSIAATLPRTEARHQMSGEREVQPARLAALMSLASRKLTTANTTTACLFLNQTRINVGQMFGNPEHTTGGKAMGYYASYRVLMRKADNTSEKVATYDSEGKKGQATQIVRQRVKAKVTKSKLGSPDREIGFDWLPNEGDIDEIGFIIGQGLADGLLVKEGTSRYVDPETGQTFHGVKKLREHIETDLATYDRLIRRLLGDET